MSEEVLLQNKKILIYGAGTLARDLVIISMILFPDKLIGCAVTSMYKNVPDIYGIDVRPFDSYKNSIDKHNTVIIVAVPKKYTKEISDMLIKEGYKYVIDAASDDDYVEKLREKAICKTENGVSFPELKNHMIKSYMYNKLESFAKRYESVKGMKCIKERI